MTALIEEPHDIKLKEALPELRFSRYTLEHNTKLRDYLKLHRSATGSQVVNRNRFRLFLDLTQDLYTRQETVAMIGLGNKWFWRNKTRRKVLGEVVHFGMKYYSKIKVDAYLILTKNSPCPPAKTD